MVAIVNAYQICLHAKFKSFNIKDPTDTCIYPQSNTCLETGNIKGQGHKDYNWQVSSIL